MSMGKNYHLPELVDVIKAKRMYFNAGIGEPLTDVEEAFYDLYLCYKYGLDLSKVQDIDYIDV